MNLGRLHNSIHLSLACVHIRTLFKLLFAVFVALQLCMITLRGGMLGPFDHCHPAQAGEFGLNQGYIYAFSHSKSETTSVGQIDLCFQNGCRALVVDPSRQLLVLYTDSRYR